MMRKFLHAIAGIGAAALVGAAGICTVRFWNRSDGPVSPVELERTQEEESYERTDRKDPNTEIPLKELYAYYGCITEVTDQDVLVQGLESNAVNDRGLIFYAKNDIAMISGYVDGQQRSRFEDLQALSQDTLIAAAASYAKKIGEKASDSKDLEWMRLSEDVAEHVKEAAPLSGLVPQEAMVLSLSEEVMLSYMEAAGMKMPTAEEGKKQMYHMGVIALGNLLNSQTSEAAVLGAMSVLSRQEYLWMEQLSEATCVWLYYGSEVPSVFAAFLPRTDTVTEIDVTPVDPSVYLQISSCVQAGDEKVSDDTGFTEIASIFADVQFCTDLTAVDLSGDSLQGLCAPTDDTEGNGEFYQKIVTELIDAVPDDMTELKSLYSSSDQLLEQLNRIHTILREVKNAQQPIEITSWQLPQDNPYTMSQLSTSVGNICGVLQLASSSVMAQLLHVNQPIYTCPRSWSQDVLLYAELPGLVILVSAQAADNGFLAITPNLILTDEPEQIRQLIEGMGLEG